MNELDEILAITSSGIFLNLDYSHHRLLKFLAIDGLMNLTEIGKKTSTRSSRYSFDRWGVKDRLIGSKRLLGLIPNDYVYETKINKKESNYGLTLKGVLASLSRVPFDEIYKVKNYKKFLHVYFNDRILETFAIEFIKNEIALILLYNYAVGLNWTKFRYVKSYVNNLKKHKQIIQPFFLDYTILQINDRENFQNIRDEYLKLFYVFELYRRDCEKESVEDGLKKLGKEIGANINFVPYSNTMRRIVHQWYVYLGSTDMEIAEQQLLNESVDIKDPDFIVPDRWYHYQIKATKSALAILKENGFKVSRKITLGGTPP